MEIAYDLDIVKCLLDYGADLTAKSNDGWTLLHFAAVNYSIDVVNFLIDEKGFGTYYYASSKCHYYNFSF